MTPDQKDALIDFFAATDRLLELNIIRSSRYLGDIGEFLYTSVFGGKLAPGLRTPGHDAIQDGKTIQVKFNNSPKSTNTDVGAPHTYEELVVVLGPRSKLREATHQNGEYRFYRFSSDDVKLWRTNKEKIAACAFKHTL